MFPESKVTEIYCLADDFCKEFTLHQENIWLRIRKPSIIKNNRMSDGEIMVILILYS